MKDGKIVGKFRQNGANVDLTLTKNSTPKDMSKSLTFDIPAETGTLLGGKWEGILKVEILQKLRIELIFRTENGGKKCKEYLISPDQSAAEIPLTMLKAEKSKIKICAQSIGVEMNGVLRDKKMEMNFSQNGLKRKISFAKSE